MEYDSSKHPHLASWRERMSDVTIKYLRCPSCHRKGYKPYLYPDGTLVHEECGRCDHESSCGYHVSPKEWFREHPDNSDGRHAHDVKPSVPPVPPPMVSIPWKHVIAASCLNPGAGHNPLLRYWWTFFSHVPEERRQTALLYTGRMTQALRKYHVGTLQAEGTGYTIWWIIDENGIVRSGKAMRYKADGHRDKTHPRAFIWMHRLAGLREEQPEHAQYVSCLFGLHRLKEGVTEVHIVESEKTAVMMSVFRPDLCWMATMGLGNLNRFALSPLIEKGILIVCHPDKDGYDKWDERVRQIRHDEPNVRIHVSDYVNNIWRPGDNPKSDILDLMEREYTRFI